MDALDKEKQSSLLFVDVKQQNTNTSIWISIYFRGTIEAMHLSFAVHDLCVYIVLLTATC